MRVKISPAKHGKKSKSDVGTVVDELAGKPWMASKPSERRFDSPRVFVRRDGIELPQVIRCDRLTPLDPADDNMETTESSPQKPPLSFWWPGVNQTGENYD